jgi:Chaperone of endosialidase
MANVVTNPSSDQTIQSHNLLPASGNTTQSLGSASATWNAAFGQVSVESVSAQNAAFGQVSVESVSAQSVNGILNALEYDTANLGVDIGAQVMAAITALLSASPNGGTILIPAGTYPQLTTILLPRYVKLCGASAFGTVLNYTPTTGWAICVADSLGIDGFVPLGAVEDLNLNGPGKATNSGGIYIGGTDGVSGAAGTVNTSGYAVTWASGSQFGSWASGTTIIINGTGYIIKTVNSATSISLMTSTGSAQTGVGYVVVSSPEVGSASDYGDNVNINRVRLGNFGIGIQWGANAWGTTIFESLIALTATGLNFPNSSLVSGENICIISGVIGNNDTGVFTVQSSSGTDFHFDGVSFDSNNSWAVQAGTPSKAGGNISLVACHVEQPSNWLQNYGSMSVTASYFINGSASVDYFIDNESTSFVMTACELIDNIGAANLFNPSGTKAVILGCYSNSAFNNYATYIDVFGNVYVSGQATATVVDATGGFQANGTAGVSTGPYTSISSITTKLGIVTALSGSSDARLKTTEPFAGGLEEIAGIVPVRYSWNEEGERQTGLNSSQKFVGFTAQNVQSVLPEAITSVERSKEGDETFLCLDDRAIVALLVNCVKELRSEVEELRERGREASAHLNCERT